MIIIIDLDLLPAIDLDLLPVIDFDLPPALYLLLAIAVPGILLPSRLIVLVEVASVEVVGSSEVVLVLLAVEAGAIKEGSGFAACPAGRPRLGSLDALLVDQAWVRPVPCRWSGLVGLTTGGVAAVGSSGGSELWRW